MVYRPRIDEKLCFVLMPFRDPFDGYYQRIIKEAVKAAGLEPLRADEIYGTRAIIRDVWEQIWRARVIIADVTDRNPNVNYELGLCHSLGVPTILITQKTEDVPVDYRHRRYILYNTKDATWVDDLKRGLTNTLQAVLSDGSDQELQWPYDTFLVKQLVGTSTTISVENPRQIILRGMAEVTRLIGRAFGPRGANVSVTLSPHHVVSHKQGLTIAQGIHSANSIEENGIEQMRKVGQAISNAVGDGSKTAMLLTHALVEGGQASLDQGHSLQDLLSGTEKALIAARSWLIGHSQSCTHEHLAAVALTASDDRCVSDLVVSAIKAAGKDGVIIVDTKAGANSELLVQEGLQFDRGYLSHEFITNVETQECELADCFVLVHELKISNMRDFLPLLEEVARQSRPLLVIADNVEGEALATLVVNNVRGTIKCAAVRAPGVGDHGRALLHDIAIFTGAKFLSADLGRSLDSLRLEDLGSANKIVVTGDSTTIFGGHGFEVAVQAQISSLRNLIDVTRDYYAREKLQERLANLVGKIATIRLGGTTEIDVEDQRYRATSALHATRAALEAGYSSGGGIALLNSQEAIATLSFQSPGEEAGAKVASKALEEAFVTLAESCRKSPVTLLSERHQLGDPRVGLNVKTAELQDMVAAEIIDPTKMLTAAIDIAFSYARAILKTGIWSVTPEQPEELPKLG